MEVGYETWSVPRLKEELKLRNSKTSGRKSALVQRLQTLDSASYVPGESETNQENDPTRADSAAWPQSTDFKMYDGNQQESLTNVEISFFFASHSQSVSRMKVENQAGYKMLHEMFLLSLLHAGNGEADFFRAHVHAEMSKTVTYYAYVRLHGGSVEFCHCECPAGAGPHATCKHVATVLYAIEHAGRTGEVLVRKSVTQKQQKWHEPKRVRVAPCALSSRDMPLNVSQASSSDEHHASGSGEFVFDPRQEHDRNVPKAEKQARLRSLLLNYHANKSGPQMAIMQGFDDKANWESIMLDHDYLDVPLDIQWLFRQLKDTDVGAVEQHTRGQTTSKLWHAERSLRITASNVSTIINMKTRDPHQLAAALVAGTGAPRFAATTWGRNFEPQAIKRYEELTGCGVMKSGLVIHPELRALAASPDGIVGDKVIEVKCPYSIRKSDISPSNYSHIEIKEGALMLKRSSPYWWQVQTQMFCTDKVECDFVVCTKVDTKIISVPADTATFRNVALPKLASFYDTYMVPAILSAKLGITKPSSMDIDEELALNYF